MAKNGILSLEGKHLSYFETMSIDLSLPLRQEFLSEISFALNTQKNGAVDTVDSGEETLRVAALFMEKYPQLNYHSITASEIALYIKEKKPPDDTQLRAETEYQIALKQLRDGLFGNNCKRFNKVLSHYLDQNANVEKLAELIGTPLGNSLKNGDKNAWNVLKVYMALDIADQLGTIPIDMAQKVKDYMADGKMEILFVDFRLSAKELVKTFKGVSEDAFNAIVHDSGAAYDDGRLFINSSVIAQDEMDESVFACGTSYMIIHELTHAWQRLRTNNFSIPHEIELEAYSVSVAYDIAMRGVPCRSELDCINYAAKSEEVAKSSQRRFALTGKLDFLNTREMQKVHMELSEKAAMVRPLGVLVGWYYTHDLEKYNAYAKAFREAYDYFLVLGNFARFAATIQDLLKKKPMLQIARSQNQSEVQMAANYVSLYISLKGSERNDPLPDIDSNLVLSNPKTIEVLMDVAARPPTRKDFEKDARWTVFYQYALLYVCYMKSILDPNDGAKFFKEIVIPGMTDMARISIRELKSK